MISRTSIQDDRTLAKKAWSYVLERVLEGRKFLASLASKPSELALPNRRSRQNKFSRRSIFRSNLGANMEMLEGRAMMAVLLSDGLNNTATSVAVNGGAYFSGQSGAATTNSPATTDQFSEGTHSYGIANGTATITSQIVDTTTYTSLVLSVKLASFSIGSNANGADAGDTVIVAVSTNGGTSYLDTLRIAGNTNARWSFTSGTGIASTAYDGDATAVSFVPTAGGLRTTDGYSSLQITNLPQSANLRFRITVLNDAANERWFVDDIRLTGDLVGNVAPTVTSPTSASITASTATLGGNITSNGGATVTASGIVYAPTGTNNNPEIGGAGVTVVSSSPLATSGVFTVPVSGLTGSTGYSFKAFATNSQGTTYTTVSTFTTQGAPVAPTVTSPTSTAITFDSATLGGNVTSDGNSTITARGVVYALTSANASPTLDGTGTTTVTGSGTTGVFTVSATGLTASSGYSFVAYATNAQGTTYSSVGTFTTSAAPVAPTVTSPTATSIASTSATLGGNVTADGNATITARGVVYSLTSANANPQIGGAGVTNVVGTGTTGVFTVSATGLTQLSGYSYAAYATNSVGTTYSTVSTFNTLTAPSGWDFGTTASTTAPPTSSPANATLSNLTRGNLNFGMTETLIQINSVSTGYVGATGTGNATVAAVGGVLNTASSAYFEFTVTPNSGFKTALTGVSFGARSTSSGPTNYSIRNSADSYASDLATGTLVSTTPNGTWFLISPTLTTTTSTNAAPLTYRIYGFGGTAAVATATSPANWRIDDLSLTSSTTALASPSITVTAPSATYTGLAYAGASSTVTGAGSPAPVVSFTYYAGPTATGSPVTPINIGQYTVVASSPANAGNNASTSAPVTFNINAAPLTITADAKSKAFGASDPALTYTTTSFVNGETASTALSGTLSRVAGEAPGTYAINQGSVVAVNGNYAITYQGALLTIAAAPAPTFTSASVNGGDTFLNSAQRSQLTSLVLNFSAPVVVAANAFTVANVGLFTAQSAAALASSQILVTGSGTNQITLRWGSGSGVQTRSGSGALGNSLMDGNWQLTIDPTKITTGGTAMTGNASFGTLASDNFFRMYGDSNGDGVIAGNDLSAYRTALTTFNAAFDFNGDGVVGSTGVDYTNFVTNYGKRRRTL